MYFIATNMYMYEKKHLTVAQTGHVFLPYMAYECITNLTNKIKNKYIHIIKMYTHFC